MRACGPKAGAAIWHLFRARILATLGKIFHHHWYCFLASAGSPPAAPTCPHPLRPTTRQRAIAAPPFCDSRGAAAQTGRCGCAASAQKMRLSLVSGRGVSRAGDAAACVAAASATSAVQGSLDTLTDIRGRHSYTCNANCRRWPGQILGDAVPSVARVLCGPQVPRTRLRCPLLGRRAEVGVAINQSPRATRCSSSCGELGLHRLRGVGGCEALHVARASLRAPQAPP